VKGSSGGDSSFVGAPAKKQLGSKTKYRKRKKGKIERGGPCPELRQKQDWKKNGFIL